MFKSKCYQGGERHKFIPFYEEIKPDPELFYGERVTANWLKNVSETLTKRIYRFHICEWCGKKIKEE